MKTLIELYDERPIENVLAADVFKPQRVIYLCPTEVAQSKILHKKITEFLRKRNPDVEVLFFETSQYYTKKVVAQLEKLIDTYEDCAIDITGGTDNTLFAAGRVSVERNVAAFTYSHRSKRFYDISGAEFAEGVECHDLYSISDFIEMAGGKADTGRVQYEDLQRDMEYIMPLFRIFLKNRTKWSDIVSWIQQASREPGLSVDGADYRQKGDRGRLMNCPEDCLRDLEKSGLIHNLKIEDKVSFRFQDKQIRFWLRDVGSALEAFTFKRAYDSGMFRECKCSVILEWESEDAQKNVYNEVDVMTVQGVTPYFISCKACKINTYALNELEILRNRFGGEGAVAMIVSTETCNSATRMRAAALNIQVVDLNDIKQELAL